METGEQVYQTENPQEPTIRRFGLEADLIDANEAIQRSDDDLRTGLAATEDIEGIDGRALEHATEVDRAISELKIVRKSMDVFRTARAEAAKGVGTYVAGVTSIQRDMELCREQQTRLTDELGTLMQGKQRAETAVTREQTNVARLELRTKIHSYLNHEPDFMKTMPIPNEEQGEPGEQQNLEESPELKLARDRLVQANATLRLTNEQIDANRSAYAKQHSLMATSVRDLELLRATFPSQRERIQAYEDRLRESQARLEQIVRELATRTGSFAVNRSLNGDNVVSITQRHDHVATSDRADEPATLPRSYSDQKTFFHSGGRVAFQ